MTTNSIVSGAAAITAICVSVAIAPVCHADDGEEARDLLMAVDVAFRKDASLAESEEGKGLRSGLASRLREADPKSRDYNQQNWLVRVVGDFVRDDIFRRMRHLPENAWKIRFAELAWERDYIDSVSCQSCLSRVGMGTETFKALFSGQDKACVSGLRRRTGRLFG